MTTEPHVPGSSTATSGAIASRVMMQRRRRVIRSALTVLGVTVVMLVLTIMNRDQQAVESCRHRMETAQETLQEQHQEWLRDPQKFPLRAVAAQLGDVWREHVLDNWRFSEQAAFARRVGVCCCERPHSRLFRPAGRHVIIFHGGEHRYELIWMNEGEFAEQAEQLGLQVTARR